MKVLQLAMDTFVFMLIMLMSVHAFSDSPSLSTAHTTDVDNLRIPSLSDNLLKDLIINMTQEIDSLKVQVKELQDFVTPRYSCVYVPTGMHDITLTDGVTVTVECINDYFGGGWMVIGKAVAMYPPSTWLWDYHLATSHSRSSSEMFSIPLRLLKNEPTEILMGFEDGLDVYGFKVPSGYVHSEAFNPVQPSSFSHVLTEAFFSPVETPRKQYGLRMYVEDKTLVGSRRDNVAGGIGLALQSTEGGHCYLPAVMRNSDAHGCYVGYCKNLSAGSTYVTGSSTYYTEGDYSAALGKRVSQGAMPTWVAVR